jgi:hypothetical protein
MTSKKNSYSNLEITLTLRNKADETKKSKTTLNKCLSDTHKITRGDLLQLNHFFKNQKHGFSSSTNSETF